MSRSLAGPSKNELKMQCNYGVQQLQVSAEALHLIAIVRFNLWSYRYCVADEPSDSM